MGKQKTSLLAFNRGLLSKRGLQRLDLNRTALSSEIQTNWIASTLGPMMLRPGTGYIDTLPGVARNIPFVRTFDYTGLMEFSSELLRIRLDDELIERESVSTVITNEEFTTDLTGWTGADEAGATSQWVAGGFMSLSGTGSNEAKRIQEVATVDTGVEHGVRFVIERGPVTLRVGSTSDADDYVTERVLRTGEHSFAITPTGNFFISLSTTAVPAALVSAVRIEDAGVMELPTPWDEDDLKYVRKWQENDVVFVACKNHQQRRIERHAPRSWSVVLYTSDTGPFMLENTGPITLTPSALTGDITLTASKDLFRSGNVGSLYRITSSGQTTSAVITGDDQFTGSIRVTGVEGQRPFSIILTGVVDSTVTLQMSLDDATWTDVQSFTEDFSASFDDDLENQLIYYRIGVKGGDYGSDTIDAQLIYTSGSSTGIVRVTAFTSRTVVSAAVLFPLGSLDASTEWWESFWSDRRGWPSAVTLFESRLYWFGKGWVWGSIVDQYEDYDDFFEGDAGPIIRSISGPSDEINWALELEMLLFGTVQAEVSAHSSTQDEPLTPTNFQLKDVATQGSAPIDAVKLDDTGIVVQRSLQRVLQMEFKPGESISYKPIDLTIAVPDLNRGTRIVGIALQREPDTRLHVWRGDGTVMILSLNRDENIVCWQKFETAGEVIDVAILPGLEEDIVYYTVLRGEDYFLEKWALESECIGDAITKLADSFVVYDEVGTPTSTLTVAHLDAGTEVVVWADGVDLGTFTVGAAGAVALGQEVEQAVVGLPYEAPYKSSRLGEATGTPLNLPKKVDHLGLLLLDTHPQGLRFGPTFERLSDMPLIEGGTEVDQDAVHEEYDEPMIDFEGEWTTNARICLLAAAPRPCTVLAASVRMTVSE